MDAFAFDLDGTLADLEVVEVRAVRAAFAIALGQEPSDELVAAYRKSLHSLEVRIREGAISSAHFRRERFLAPARELGVPLTEENLPRMTEIFQEITTREIRLYPDAERVLEALSGERLLLLTNGPSTLQRAKLRTLGLEDTFEAVFISEEVGHAKPDPLFFQAVTEKTGLARDQIAFFGDNPVADVGGGIRAGMVTVWISRDGAPFPQGLQPPEIWARDLEDGLQSVRERFG